MRHNCLDNLEWFEEEVPNGDNDMCVHSGYVCDVCGEYPDNQDIENYLKNKEARKKLGDLYDFVSKSFPDTASAISVAEDTLMKEIYQGIAKYQKGNEYEI